MSFSCISVLVFGLMVTVNSAPNKGCSIQYQAALQQVLDFKETCTDAIFKDCCEASNTVIFSAEVLNSNPPTSGIYHISDVCGGKVHAFHEDILTQQARCTDVEDGGWTVILRRNTNIAEKVNFSRGWNDYVQRFGDLNTEFWYGLRNIHCLTSRQQVQLRMLLNFTNGSSFLWTYNHFVVDRPESEYTLHIGQAEGPNTLDTMAHSNGWPFTTYDNDNDAQSGTNCAVTLEGGGWWHNNCNYCEVTCPSPQIYPNGYLDYVEMKVRSTLCKSVYRM